MGYESMAPANDNEVLPRPESAETDLSVAIEEAIRSLKESFGGVIPSGKELEKILSTFEK